MRLLLLFLLPLLLPLLLLLLLLLFLLLLLLLLFFLLFLFLLLLLLLTLLLFVLLLLLLLFIASFYLFAKILRLLKWVSQLTMHFLLCGITGSGTSPCSFCYAVMSLVILLCAATRAYHCCLLASSYRTSICG